MEVGMNTQMLHGYPVIDPYTGAASIPKYQTSTFDRKHFEPGQPDYLYSRFSNPTVDALEEAISHLCQSEYGFAFGSGMAAISNALMLAKNGDHIILPKEVYGGTYQFASQILPQFGVATSFIDYADFDQLKAAIQPNTRLLYIETPSNPLLKIVDLRQLIKLAKDHNLLTVVDNTFMTTLYQNPLKLGADVIVESMTKFINGHSDVVAGLIATNRADLVNQLKLYQKNFGGIIGVEDAWLILRGMKTMGLRMSQACKNAQAVAEFLSSHPKVAQVYYPGLTSHPNYAIHQSQASSGGAVLSFSLRDQVAMTTFLSKIKWPIFAVSLGGVESIISHPATMSHACMSPQERLAQGVIDELLRFSCGIEDTADLIADLEQALA